MNKTKFYTIVVLAVIFLVALAIRLYPVVKFPEEIKYGLGIFGDTHLYHSIAYNLYKGNGFSGAFDRRTYGIGALNENLQYEPAVTRGPVYPFFISLIYKFFGNEEDMKSIEDWHKNWDKIRIAQCILDALVCLLVFFIVRLIFSSSLWPALISAILYCFSFYNIFYTRALLSEAVTTFLLTLAILFYTIALKKQKKLWAFLSGAGFGLVVLSRTEYILSILVLAAYLLFVNRKYFSIAVKKSMIFIFAAIVIVFPWSLRNFLVFKEPVLVTVGAYGHNLHLGTFESNSNWRGFGRYPEEIFTDESEKEEVYSLYQSFHHYYSAGSIKAKEVNEEYIKKTLKIIRENPVRCFLIWLKRIPRLWYQNYIPMYFPLVEASGWFFVFYFAFALLAIIFSRGGVKILMVPVGILFIYLTLVFLPLHIEPRYGVALMPGIISLAGIGIWHFLLSIKNFIIRNKLIDFVPEEPSEKEN